MINGNFFERPKRIAFLGIALAFFALGWGSNAALAQKTRALSAVSTPSAQQAIYSDYRDVRLGMAAAEVRAALGEPAVKADDQDFYVFSDKETAQVVYDASGKVVIISADYLGGVGAPDYKAVVGPDIQMKADGSAYKMVRYEGLGFWVSYNRSVGPMPSVTVTIQKIRRA
jgi:outer membrane protein assembly factor BamE (lipoprotein component of BamABCDE complex)